MNTRKRARGVRSSRPCGYRRRAPGEHVHHMQQVRAQGPGEPQGTGVRVHKMRVPDRRRLERCDQHQGTRTQHLQRMEGNARAGAGGTLVQAGSRRGSRTGTAGEGGAWRCARTAARRQSARAAPQQQAGRRCIRPSLSPKCLGRWGGARPRIRRANARPRARRGRTGRASCRPCWETTWVGALPLASKHHRRRQGAALTVNLWI